MAAISAEEAARLGADLTPLGGEKAGNAAGTIPAWDGGLISAAKAGVPDLQARQPSSRIRSRAKSRSSRSTRRTPPSTPTNLTEGHKALLKRVPATRTS